jgi:menaquinone reductase, molybdopterin-binding-like subunit
VTIPRRQFIGILATAAAGAAAGFPGGRAFNDALMTADQPLFPPGGLERFVTSVCTACPGSCGIRVRRIGERVVRIAGNPLDPISGGRLCAKGQAAVQSLYHPDRLTAPLRRTGPRGRLSSFRPATWDEAMEEIGGTLRAVREEQRPEAVVLIRGASGDSGTRAASRFLDAYGSPNDIVFDRAGEAGAIAMMLTQGVRAAPAPDIHGADYILNLGSEFLEASSSPVYSSRAYGDFRQTRTSGRGKLVHVDPRLSITAAAADEWIAIRPGTHATFALGVAAAIVAEDLHDRDFVDERTSGFDGEAGNLRSVLAQYFPLERVSTATGASGNVILRVARELAGARAGLALAPNKGPLVGASVYDHLAAHVLNALIGNIDQPGGVLLAEETPIALERPRRDAVAAAGHRRPRLDGLDGDSLCGADLEQLALAFETGQPYRPEVLLIAGADPVYATTAQERFATALGDVPLVVVFATIASDTSLYADWILPQSHFLEQWNLQTSPAAVPFPIASVGVAALGEPLHDTRPLADVFLDLARRSGVGEALPWSDSPALVRAESDRLYETRRGAIVGTDFDAAWVRMMERAGWWAPGYSTADELWSRLRDSGGWWDPFYDHGDWGRVVRTPSGRLELRPDLVRQFAEAAPNAAPGGLSLIIFEPLAIAGGSGAELPFLQALLDPGLEERWGCWGEIHPDTAASLHVHDGARLRITSGRQSIVVRARVTERVVPGAVAVPLGLGRAAGGRWAAGVGANPLRLLAPAREPVSSLPDFGATRVVVDTVAPERRTSGKRS